VRIALISDAWAPQVNGVVRTLSTLVRYLEGAGHVLAPVTPDAFRTLPCPTYPEIRLAIRPRHHIATLIDDFAPEAIHIATEGPLGMAARALCIARGLPFTTAFHTRFPEYVAARFRVPTGWSYAWLRRFHAPSRGVMVATPTLREELRGRGFQHLKDWGRGVDEKLFMPSRRDERLGLPRPVFLFVGRVAVEKNLPAFLDLDLPGSKLVVGEGPLLAAFRRRYPEVHFVGKHEGEALARLYASSDVFVFPSLTDTYGLVLLEALASGLPVAAYPVTGPCDVIDDAGAGVLGPDLKAAALAALEIPRERCRAFALTHSWSESAAQFLGNLAPFR
jgi:1,2-diacylglycerol 3-alpha-glucosyltransferase/glucuronosyltransferase